MNKIKMFLLAVLLMVSCQKEPVKPDVITFEKPDYLVDNRKQTNERRINPKKLLSVIYLDFDGQYIENTSWNYSGPIDAQPSGLDSLSRKQILTAVQYYYRMFNVVVTDNEKTYLQANPYKRTRVIITTTWEWYGQSGGVAYINSFTWGDDTPCFVFSSLLGYSIKKIQDAAAHEAGHTLSLQHQSICVDGVKTTEYNPGGNGEAPIMGVSYYQANPKWWVGNTPYCYIQDDSAIIKSIVGLK